MQRSFPKSLTQPGTRSALLLALGLAILPAPAPGAGSPCGQRGAVDVVRALAGVYKRRTAHQRVNVRLTGENTLDRRGGGR